MYSVAGCVLRVDVLDVVVIACELVVAWTKNTRLTL